MKILVARTGLDLLPVWTGPLRAFFELSEEDWTEITVILHDMMRA